MRGSNYPLKAFLIASQSIRSTKTLVDATQRYGLGWLRLTSMRFSERGRGRVAVLMFEEIHFALMTWRHVTRRLEFPVMEQVSDLEMRVKRQAKARPAKRLAKHPRCFS
jgi:hypothetical protein